MRIFIRTPYRILYIIIILLVMGCQSGTWDSFTSSEGKFSALFPKNPTEEIDTLNTAIGTLEMHTFTASYRKGFFAVAYVDYPYSAVRVTPASSLLDGARDGAVERTNGRLLSEKLISLGGYPGREIKIKIETPKHTAIIRCRIYLVKNRLYQILVATSIQEAYSTIGTTFLNSFQVTAY